VAALTELAQDAGVPARRSGQFGGNTVRFGTSSMTLEELQTVHEQGLTKLLG
jgi:hypothetical protein